MRFTIPNCLTIFFSISMLLFVSSESPAEGIIDHTFQLSNSATRSLRATTRFDADKDLPEVGMFYVEFFATDPRDKVPDHPDVLFSVNISTAFKNSLTAQVFRPKGSARQLLFVSSAHGGVTSRVFDFDGRSLHSLYSQLGVRTGSSVQMDAAGTYFIRERWRPDWILDNEGDVLKLPNRQIAKYFFWNGSGFSKPNGPTHVFQWADRYRKFGRVAAVEDRLAKQE